MNIVKIWLVSFSNGEEWHICGDSWLDVWQACLPYAPFDEYGMLSMDIKYLRWV